MSSTAAKTWNGPEPLRKFLVEIDSLDPWPGNPRRGDVIAVAASLKRFGQQRPVVVHGTRIVAGHHVVLAAREEGWTHVSVVPNEFADEDEARAFMLADNRTHDIGVYDQDALVEQLKLLAEIDALEGTGYGTADLDGYMADLRRSIDQQGTSPLDGTGGKREHRDPSMKEVVLIYSPDQLAQFEEWLTVVANEAGVNGASEAVYEALRIAAGHVTG